MSEKRKDNKGRNLQCGETQRKDGMYVYRVTDENGERHSYYSWKLVETDKVPKGKRVTKSIREIRAEIERELNLGTNPWLKTDTLDAMFHKRMEAYKSLKRSTRENYISLYNRYMKGSPIMDMEIGKIKRAHVMNYLSSLHSEKGLSGGTMHFIQRVISSVFNYCIKNDLCQTNPCRDVMKEIYREKDLKDKQIEALTQNEQDLLLKAVSKDRTIYVLVLFMLSTGCRIGEALGLKWSDIDFEEDLIYIRRTFKMGKDGVEDYYDTPKTESGVRTIPLLSKIKETLLSYKEETKNINIDKKFEDAVFISASRKRPCNYTSIAIVMKKIIRKHNDREIELSKTLGEKPKLIPVISPHVLRHTFCTRLCENVSDVKVIQKIMGHANIKTTLDIYYSVTTESMKSNLDVLNMCFERA